MDSSEATTASGAPATLCGACGHPVVGAAGRPCPECGTPFDPALRWRGAGGPGFRWCFAATVAVTTPAFAWFVGMWRSFEVGFDPLGVLLRLALSSVMLLTLPALLIVSFALLGWRRGGGRRAVIALLGIVLGSTALVETTAAIEEALFLRDVRASKATGPVWKARRWWPHRSSSLGYDPATGRLWAND